MKIDDIMWSDDAREELSIISERCSQFLEDTCGSPLLMNLSKKYGDFHKVKVRMRKNREDDTFSETFNVAFKDEAWNLRERAAFANGLESFEPADNDDLEPFYIFPIDGFRFMYSTEVENSGNDYKKVFDTILEEFGADKGNEVLTDLLKFTYTSDNLYEGITQGSEIIMFNLPYFYAIRQSTVEDYKKLLSSIDNL